MKMAAIVTKVNNLKEEYPQDWNMILDYLKCILFEVKKKYCVLYPNRQYDILEYRSV